MGNKSIPKQPLSLQAEESEVVLPDESDLIIADLQRQLEALKQKVSHQEKAAPNHSEAQAESDEVIRLEIKKHHIEALIEQDQDHQIQDRLMPRTLERLKDPVQQMSDQLESLINNVADESVQNVLKECRSVALSVAQNLMKMGDKSRRLTEDMNPDKHKVDLLSFFKVLAQQHNLSSEGRVKLFRGQEVPPHIYIDEALFRQALLILFKEMHRLSPAEEIKVTLKQGNRTLYDMMVPHLEVSILGESPWNEVLDGTMQQYLFKVSETSDELVMDVLYAKKIVQQHGGRLVLEQKGDQVVGFGLTMPSHKE